jgi:hypothetical protein
MGKTNSFVLTETAAPDLGSLLAHCYYYYNEGGGHDVLPPIGGATARLSFRILRGETKSGFRSYISNADN